MIQIVFQRLRPAQTATEGVGSSPVPCPLVTPYEQRLIRQTKKNLLR